MSLLKDVESLNVRLTATIDDEGVVTLIDDRPGTPLEGLRIVLQCNDAWHLESFLTRNRALLYDRGGVSALSRRIRVWRPEIAEQRIPEAYRYLLAAMQKEPGLLYYYGTIEDEFCSGGYSEDRSVFVLVPEDLHAARVRELLTQEAAAYWKDRVHQLAESLDREREEHDPDAGQPNPLIYQAEREARQVAYWLQLAGPEPRELDSNDARRPARA